MEKNIGSRTQELRGRWSTSSVLKKDSVVNSFIFFEYSVWSLREHGLDCAKLVATQKLRDRKPANELRIMEHLMAKRSRRII